MTQLAVRNGVEIEAHAPRHVAGQQPPAFTVDEVWRIAADVAKGGLFPGAKTPEQAFTLMLICQADGLHPINAVRRFHVIEGRPSMRADAIQAEFQARGGRVRWVESTAEACEAEFTHPKFHPEPFLVRMELKRFVDNKVALTYNDKTRTWDFKKNWGNWPDAMLRARVISAGVRAVDPGVIVGISSEDEVRDLIALESPPPAALEVQASKDHAAAAVAASDEPVPGHDPRQPDTRPYSIMSTEAVAATNDLVAREWGDLPGPPAPMDARKLHGVLALKAVNAGHADGPAPTKVQAAVAFVSKVYAARRQWVRREVALACQEYAEAAAEALRAARAVSAVKPEDESQEAPDPEQGDPDVDLPEGY